jgi:hypothetical protein
MRTWPLCIALLLPGLAPAEHNSLVNPGFTTSLSGWSNPFARPATWSAFDANGSLLSGSALVTNDLNPSPGATMLALSQCFAVAPGQRISFGGKMYVPSSAPTFTFASIVLRTYTQPGCFDGLSDSSSVFGLDLDQWVNAGETVQAGAGIVSVAVFLGVSKAAGATPDASAWFDDIRLDLDTLFEDGFES